MNVFIDESIFEKQEFGGISRYFCELAKAISEHSEHRVIIYGGWSQNAYLSQLESTDTLKILFYKKRLRNLRFAKKWLNPIMRKAFFLKYRLKKERLIYHPSYFSLDSFINKYCDASVLTVHDLIYEHLKKNKSSKKTAKRKKIQDQVDQIITVSESTSRDLKAFNPSVSYKISVIHLATAPQSDQIKQERNATFLFVGNRGGYKNGTLTIEAFADLQAETKQNLRLLFVGGGEFDTDETEKIQALKLGNLAQQRNLSDQELAHAYQTSIALVFPSSYEGFGLPPLEAMQANCPTIAQKVSSIPEVLGDWGHYMETPTKEALRNQMKNLLQLPMQQSNSELANVRTKQLQKFSWEKTAQKTIQVYQYTPPDEN
mgnify:CR=1 FL=1